MKELNDLSLEKVSGGVVFIVKSCGFKITPSGRFCLCGGIFYTAVEDDCKPFNQRKCSRLFNSCFEAINYAKEKRWSTKVIDLTSV